MILRTSDFTEVRQEQTVRGECREFSEAGEAVFEVKLRRRRGHGKKRAASEACARGIAGKKDAFDLKRMVVEGMARRVVRGDAQPRELDRLPVGDRLHPLGRRRGETAPESIEAISVDAAGTFEEAARIHEVPRPPGVDVDIHSVGREPTRRPGMIEMDVGDERSLEILR